MSSAPPKATRRNPARWAGTLYLISAVPAGFSVFVLMKLFVRGDVAATATSILASESLFRLAIVGDLIGIMLVMGSVLLLYELFKPVSRRLALMMVFFVIVASGVQTLNSLQDLTALILLKGGNTMAGLTTAQAQSLAFVFLRLHSLTYDLALLFYGVFALAVGRLAFKSGFLPKALGVLMALDGLGYLTFGLATILAPAVAGRLYPVLPFATAAMGEMVFMLWLIVKGVNTQRWDERVAAMSA